MTRGSPVALACLAALLGSPALGQSAANPPGGNANSAIAIVPDPSYPAPPPPTVPKPAPKTTQAEPTKAAAPVTLPPRPTPPPLVAAAPPPLQPPPVPVLPPPAPSVVASSPPPATAVPRRTAARVADRARRRTLRVSGQYVVHRDGAFWSIVPQDGGRVVVGEVALDHVRLGPRLARAAREGWATLYVDGHWYGRELVVTELAGAVSDRLPDRPWWQRF